MNKDKCPRHEERLEVFEVDCGKCGGTGMQDNKNGTVWIDCDHCDGTGIVNQSLCEKCENEII